MSFHVIVLIELDPEAKSSVGSSILNFLEATTKEFNETREILDLSKKTHDLVIHKERLTVLTQATRAVLSALRLDVRGLVERSWSRAKHALEVVDYEISQCGSALGEEGEFLRSYVKDVYKELNQTRRW